LIFDGKPIDDISDEEIDELVGEHMSERQYLEFKATLNHQDDSDRLELLRDVVSFANAGGGYLIIGIRDDGEGHAQKYEPDMIGDRQKIKQAITSLCLDHIRDRIDGLEIRLRTVSFCAISRKIDPSLRIDNSTELSILSPYCLDSCLLSYGA